MSNKLSPSDRDFIIFMSGFLLGVFLTLTFVLMVA